MIETFVGSMVGVLVGLIIWTWLGGKIFRKPSIFLGDTDETSRPAGTRPVEKGIQVGRRSERTRSNRLKQDVRRLEFADEDFPAPPVGGGKGSPTYWEDKGGEPPVDGEDADVEMIEGKRGEE